MTTICPRCGEEGSLCRYRRNKRVYLYVHHYQKGKLIQKCYIGPEEYYVHTEHILKLSLTNLNDLDFLEVAKDSINRYISKIEIEKIEKERKIKEAIAKLEDFKKFIDDCINELKIRVKI